LTALQRTVSEPLGAVVLAVSAASSDDSGLWLVGAVLVAVGMAGATAVAAFTARALRRSRTT
jgi:hypothetical protein